MRSGQEREPNRLLIVDDDAPHRDALSQRLEGRGYSVDVVGDGAGALEKIGKSHYDLVLLEQMMPDTSGLDLLRLLRATHSPSDLPVIMVTPADESQPVLDALSGGANDFITRPVDLPVAAARIQAQLSRVRMEREARENEQRLDPVTGLGNRRLLMEQMTRRINAPGELSILLLDLDGFKVINDSFGHGTGDRILAEVGARLKSSVNGSGLVSRIGGDEFTVLLHPDVPGETAVPLAEKIQSDLGKPVLVNGRRISISASVGIVVGNRGSAEDLLRDADLAMYRAKELGKNRWQIFEPELRDRAETRMVLVHDMRHAAESGQLVAVYQPKVNLKTRRVVGFEALLRWQHPERGLLSPAEFIPLAEETGLIAPIGEWILREACTQLQRWHAKFPVLPPLTMNVNLSVKQLSDPALLDHVRQILKETAVVPETLKLELTESSLMSDLESSRTVLTGLQALHIGLKLDDFGTGYSSLAYLRALHFDSLKIDRSFVAKMLIDPEAHIIVETIIKLAQAMEMTVVAEGIEEEAQVEELLRLGCETGQGFYFSRPVVAEQAEAQIA